MIKEDENNDFLGFYGRINRKNYIINMFIVIAMLLCLNAVRFDFLSSYFTFEFFNTILDFVIRLLKFALLIALLSLIYRRISDFSSYNDKWKKIFFIVFFIPFFHLYFGYYFLSIIPPLANLFNALTLFLLPVAAICAVIFAFIKTKK